MCLLSVGGCSQEAPKTDNVLKSPFPRLASALPVHPAGSALPSDNDSNSKLLQKLQKDGCPAPPAPTRDLQLSDVYDQSDSTRSVINKQSQKRYREETRNIRHFETGLMELTNTALKKPSAESSLYSSCAVIWMTKWARAQAYLGKSNEQGEYVRQWGLAVLANAYVQLKYLNALSAEDENFIAPWLRQIAETVMDSFNKDRDELRKKNNHLYWSAWSLTITGVALNERKFYEWGVQKIKYALEMQVTDEGTLPLELRRGRKALHYHNFALTPMILVMETALKNGDNLYNVRGGIFETLAQKVFEGIKNPAVFEDMTGIEQDRLTDLSTGHFAWIEIYTKRYSDKEMEEFLMPIRPLISHRAGGDVTYLFNTAISQ